jgi:Tfp pilus assembly protein PilF
MPITDRFGLPLTTVSAAAADPYVEAVDLLLSANTGAGTLLKRALAIDPDFALAHAARARLHQLVACPRAFSP